MTRTLLFAVLLRSAVAYGASFNCKLARTPQEHAICDIPQLSALDDQLGIAYQRIRVAASPQLASSVHADQEQWLHSIATSCRAATPQPQAKLAACLADRYRARLTVFKNKYRRLGGVLFVTRTESLTAPIAPADRLPSDDGDNTSLNASWPQADSADPVWLAWNAAVEEQVRKMSRPEGDPHPDWNASWAKDVTADVRAEIEFLDDRLITTHIESDFMGHGAAHPAEEWLDFTWLRQEKRPLRIADVFRPGSAWSRTVTELCNAGLSAQSKASNGTVGYGGKMQADGLAKVIASPGNWLLDETGLTVSFPEYTVSPRYATPAPVTVPWSALQPFLAANFVRPHGKASLVGAQAGGY